MLRITTAALALLASALAAPAEPFRFVAIGDMPYGKPEEVYRPFEALIGAINAAAPDLVLHIGDTKSGGTPCSDQMLADQLNYLNSFASPLLYTPGDNEWTDCHRKNAGGFDPLERLAHLRQTYFADPATSFGKAPVAVESQADRGYPENVRLLHKEVMFVTAHVVGSNNNFEPRDIKAVEEFMARDDANVRWLRRGFEAAATADAKAMVVAIQADMFEFDWNAFGDETWLRHSGFGRFGAALQEAAAAFGKPVLLVYGDSHIFRLTRPFPKTAPNLVALEVFGDKDMHATIVTADPATREVFSFGTLLNPAM
ncbi:MAG TPA: metallophosphoesterase [Paracoccaceae bacterium]|nr:metallophosphoesterase [Paracoccaceae bacterium]